VAGSTKTKAARPHKSAKAHDAFAPLDCEVASYEFEVDTEMFDLKRFYVETGLPPGEKYWSTVFSARGKRSGYHVHFDGNVKGKDVNLTLKYYGRSVTRPPAGGPFAETAMEWIGSFFRKPKCYAIVYSRFSKPNQGWRSRFNLPFRVTMSGSKAEVVIDGIALELPKNPFGAVRGWINRSSRELDASVLMHRSIEFSTFRIEDEISVYNEAIKIFVEETKGRS
jgi:hypothetical protein